MDCGGETQQFGPTISSPLTADMPTAQAETINTDLLAFLQV